MIAFCIDFELESLFAKKAENFSLKENCLASYFGFPYIYRQIQLEAISATYKPLKLFRA